MNIERQKTDAIADAVEIPEGATHYREYTGNYFKINKDGWFIFLNGSFKKYQGSRFINLIKL